MTLKKFLADLAGKLPFAVKPFWSRRRAGSASHYYLHGLEKYGPDLLKAVKIHAPQSPNGRKIYLFASWFYWIDYCAVMGLALAAQGHRVTLGYIPHSKFFRPVKKAELRKQALYTRKKLRELEPWVRSVSLLHLNERQNLPAEVEEFVRQTAVYDSQYTLQTEDFDPGSDLYQLRYERNRQAARGALAWLKKDRPDVLLIPNGMILEYNPVYQVARSMNIPVGTFEFNGNHEELWLSQNDIVMQLNTDSLWQALGSQPLTADQLRQIRDLESARMGARAFGNSERLWQDVPSAGGQEIRARLGLDERPVVLMATNVLGDSMTLGRNIFASSMAEWITRTIRFFADRPQVQLVVRIHPGERLSTGPSMAEVAQAALEHLPEHIHLVGPMEKVNTYDLMELARMGLVYTTTAGLEMALNHIPVIVSGQTHYRDRGFTYDPASWEEYFRQIDELIAAAPRLSAQQVELAWRYAYLFFFVYPLPFPWQITTFVKDLEKWPMERVLGPEGQSRFGRVFRFLAGDPIDWKMDRG